MRILVTSCLMLVASGGIASAQTMPKDQIINCTATLKSSIAILTIIDKNAGGFTDTIKSLQPVLIEFLKKSQNFLPDVDQLAMKKANAMTQEMEAGDKTGPLVAAAAEVKDCVDRLRAEQSS